MQQGWLVAAYGAGAALTALFAWAKLQPGHDVAELVGLLARLVRAALAVVGAG